MHSAFRNRRRARGRSETDYFPATGPVTDTYEALAQRGQSTEQTATSKRSHLVERGWRLEYFTIAWNSLDALAALISGFGAGSVALVGFGLDTLIKLTPARP